MNHTKYVIDNHYVTVIFIVASSSNVIVMLLYMTANISLWLHFMRTTGGGGIELQIQRLFKHILF